MTIEQLGFHETFIENYQDELTASMSNTDLTFNVADDSLLPSSGFFRILIDSELILCKGSTSNVVTVAQRGIEGTTSANHTANTEVLAVATAGGLQRFMLDHRAVCFQEDSTIRTIAHGRFHDEDNNILSVSDFTWVNQGSATATDINGAIYMTVPDEANPNLRMLLLTAPATPWRALVKVNLGIGMGDMDNTGTQAGLIMRESSTGKLTATRACYGGRLAFVNFDDPTTSAGAIDTNLSMHENSIWLRIDDNGSTVAMRASDVGIGFTRTADSAWWTQSRTAHMSSGPDQIGIYISSGTNSGSSGSGPCVCHATFEAFRLEEL